MAKENRLNGNGHARKALTKPTINEQLLKKVDVVNAQLQRFFDSTLDKRRDYNNEFGYPETEELTGYGPDSKYKLLYDRMPIATRVVEVLPDECWKDHPEIIEDEDPDTCTPFEQAFDQMCNCLSGESWFKNDEEVNPFWEYLRRADIQAGIGHYGVILLGFNDGKPLSMPVDGIDKHGFKAKSKKAKGVKAGAGRDKQQPTTEGKAGAQGTPAPVTNLVDFDQIAEDVDAQQAIPSGIRAPVEGQEKPAEGLDKRGCRKLMYMRCYDESMVQITQWETDKRSPRYGQPTQYQINFSDMSSPAYTGVGVPTQTQNVHWTRVIHITDNIGNNETVGTPRMRPVVNNLIDLVKIYGGGAEGFWKNAVPLYSVETHPQLGVDVDVDYDDVEQQIWDLTNSFQRFLSIQGAAVKPLGASVPDPGANVEVQIQAICIKLNIPQRIFMGSERGELSSGQDADEWRTRLKSRRMNFITPRIIMPIINRLIAVDVLPAPKKSLICRWPKPGLAPQDQATIANTQTTAIAAYVAGGVNALIPEKHYLTKIIGLRDAEVEEILCDATEAVAAEGDPGTGSNPLGAKQAADAEKQTEQLEMQQENDLKMAKEGGKQPLQPGQPGQPGGFPPKKKPGFPPTGNANPEGCNQYKACSSTKVDVERSAELAKKHKCVGSHCFLNASKVVQGEPDLVYEEGLFMPLDPEDEYSTAIEHAWARSKDGKIIDPTFHEPGVYQPLVSAKPDELKKLPKGGSVMETRIKAGDEKLKESKLQELSPKQLAKAYGSKKRHESRDFDYRVNNLTSNIFCATGPGGGIDATCSPGQNSGGAVGAEKGDGGAGAKGPIHNVNVDADENGDGVTDAARVGVPALEVPPPPKVPRLPNLTEDEREVETAFAEKFEADPDGMAEKFLTAVVARAGDGPPTFGTDDAKELSEKWSKEGMSLEERSANRAQYNLALHQTANAVTKRAFLQHLDTLQPGDEIMVTVGGCGAGKGYALKKVPQALEAKGNAKAVWDSAGDQNATENPWIQQEAEARGLKVNYVYVHADPETQWAHPERGVVQRATNPEDGRMVDAKVFADSYAIGAKNHEAFYQANKDNPKARFMFLQNGAEPKLLDGIPQAALKIDRHELAAFALKTVREREALPPPIIRGATMGTRVWKKELSNNKLRPEYVMPTISMDDWGAAEAFEYQQGLADLRFIGEFLEGMDWKVSTGPLKPHPLNADGTLKKAKVS